MSTVIDIKKVKDSLANSDENFDTMTNNKLKKYASAGNVYAQNELGDRFYTGYQNIKDYTEAFKWYEKAALSGFKTAEYNLGDMYYCGLGTDKDYEKAFEWFYKAALNGITEAQCNLGCMYEDGDGVEKNYEEARKWFKKLVKKVIIFHSITLAICI